MSVTSGILLRNDHGDLLNLDSTQNVKWIWRPSSSMGLIRQAGINEECVARTFGTMRSLFE